MPNISSRISLNYKGKFAPWLVCLSASLFFFYEFLQMNMFNAIAPELIKSFGIGSVELGELAAYYFFATVIFLVPAGILLDRISTRKLFSSAMLVCVVGTVIFALSNSFHLAKICRFMAGIGGSFALLGCIHLASRWFPPKRLAFIIGLTITIAMLGAVAAQTPLTVVTELLGWRKTLLLDAAIGMVFLTIIWVFVRDSPEKDVFMRQDTKEETKNFKTSIKRAFLNPQNWLGGIYTCLMNLPLGLIGAVWGSLYFTQIHRLSITQSSYITTALFVGTIIGSPLAGWLSDRIARRRLPLLVGGAASLVLILVAIYTPNISFYSLIIIFFCLGFTSSTQVLGYPIVAESNARTLTGISSGLTCAIIMGGTGLSQPLFGWILASNWNHTIKNGLPVYSLHNFQEALLIIPLGFIVALIAASLIRETYCKTAY